MFVVECGCRSYGWAISPVQVEQCCSVRIVPRSTILEPRFLGWGTSMGIKLGGRDEKGLLAPSKIAERRDFKIRGDENRPLGTMH
jgi:hypothetical protein